MRSRNRVIRISPIVYRVLAFAEQEIQQAYLGEDMEKSCRKLSRVKIYIRKPSFHSNPVLSVSRYSYSIFLKKKARVATMDTIRTHISPILSLDYKEQPPL